MPFKLIYFEGCLNEEDAKRREGYLKTTQGRRFMGLRLINFQNAKNGVWQLEVDILGMENKKDCPMCKVSDDVLKTSKGDDFDNGEKKKKLINIKRKAVLSLN